MALTMRSGSGILDGWDMNIFSDDQVRAIHNATLDVFEEVGVRVDHNQRALEIFQSHGCRVETRDGHGIVKIPGHLVEECIAAAPETTTFKGRNPEQDLVMDAHRVTFTCFGEMIRIIDPETRQVRPTTERDVADVVRLCDSCDEVGYVHRPLAALDRPLGTHPVYNARAMLANTGKHITIGPINSVNLKVIAAIANAHLDGRSEFVDRPMFTTIVCPSSPLRLEGDCADMIIDTAAIEGGGIICAGVPQPGASTPATLAGSVILSNAQALACVVLAQLVRKGTRMVYGQVGTIMDLKVMTAPYGAPEMGMLSAAMGRLARFYGLPCVCTAMHSDAKVVDAQAGYEAVMGGLLNALSGVNIVNGLGTLELGLTFDYAKFMLDVEQVRSFDLILKGIPTDDVQMAIQAIRDAGPDGEFMTHRHTFDHMRAMSQAELFDRRSRTQWESLDQSDLVERAYALAARRIETHQPMPVSDSVSVEVDGIIADYMAEYHPGKD